MFKKMQTGFSIIEIVLVIGIIAVITVISSNLLTRTYKTSSDAELISKLKQNGAKASDVIGEAIRMADSVVCYDTVNPKKRIVIQTSTGKYWLFRFAGPGSGNGYIAKQENLDPINLASFCTLPPDEANEVIITDNNPDTGVSITDGEFIELYDGKGDKDTVTIKFKVKPAINQGGLNDEVSIQTTIQVR